MNKAKSQRSHAKRRAAERAGLSLGRHEMSDLVRQIQRGEAMFVRRQSNRVTEWMVTHDGVECRVIYDKMRKNIVTFLPLSQPVPEPCT